MCYSGGWRPADWLTAGAPRASCTQATERRGEEGEEDDEEEKKKKKAKRRIHFSSPLLDRLSHLRFRALPSVREPRHLSQHPLLSHSQFTPVKDRGVVRSVTTKHSLGNIGRGSKTAGTTRPCPRGQTLRRAAASRVINRQQRGSST